MTNSQVRVRFAPSPTGYLHIGGLRSALFNWLFARHHKGIFLVRIEDTDRERSKQEYTNAILQTMSWVALDPDEPILVQSSRTQEHKALVKQLLEQGKAYRCYCSDQDLIDRHPEVAFLQYDGFCRDKQHEKGIPYAVRFKVPEKEKRITFTDLIRGPVTFDLDQFGDFIIQRSDGNPIYNFVVVADDAFMRITHVIRGEDHISNTPKQILLYQALGLPVPLFAHLPLILGPSGDRLSKRDAATDVRDYRKKGYLPEALLNYLVRLGWSHGDQELFTRQELIDLFTLHGVGKKGSIFDQQKLDWVNSVYIREESNDFLLDYLVDEVEPNLLSLVAPWSRETTTQAIGLFKDRVSTLEKLCADLVLLSQGPAEYKRDELISTDINVIDKIISSLEQCEEWQEPPLKVTLKKLAKELGVTFLQVAQPIRIALLGNASGPGVFQMLMLVGKTETVRRLRRLYDALNA